MSESSILQFCPDVYRYVRRQTREVKVGNIGIGGHNPIRVQSMLTSDTRDTEACVKEALALAAAGSELIRLTAQTKVYAENLENIARELHKLGCFVPLVADIHFKPDAAMEAAKWVEKIRVNPGNFIDKKRHTTEDFTESEYAEELDRLREAFTPLVLFCKEHGRAIRIGTNHGSLSERIMNRYGDTPAGMVESAFEFARIARSLDFHNFIFSMKSSNTKVMIEAYRLLVAKLNEAGPDWNYPIHLGVTEAGEGEDGRIKSAVGIGSLLNDGIGDTLRVSLTGNAVQEIPVAQLLSAPFQPDTKTDDAPLNIDTPPSSVSAAPSTRLGSPRLSFNNIEFGNGQVPRVVVNKNNWETYDALENKKDLPLPEFVLEDLSPIAINPVSKEAKSQIDALIAPTIITVDDHTSMGTIQAFRLLSALNKGRHAILLKDTLNPEIVLKSEEAALVSAQVIGSLLCDGIGDAVYLRLEQDIASNLKLTYNILQAANARITKTEYISCPSCGRTLYTIQDAVHKIREATGHLKGLRIAIMGCIVNGPGEMADADFGFVGGAPKKINLYVKKTPVKFNIPQEDAVDELVKLIKEHGCWVDKK